MTNGPDEPRLEPGDERLLELIRRHQRSIGRDTPLPSDEAVLAYLEDRASAAHLEEIRMALERRPALASWLAELIEARDELAAPTARERFDSAQPPPLQQGLLRRAVRLLEREEEKARAPAAASSARQWWLAGWATLATAAAGVLLVVQVQQPSPIQHPTPSNLVQAPVEPSRGSTPPFSLEFTSEVFAPRLLRSAGIDTFEIVAPVRPFRLTAEPPAHPPGAQSRVKVELEGPRGGRFVSVATIAELTGEGRILVIGPELESGRYLLSLKGLWPGAPADSTPYPFYLEVHLGH